MSSDNIFEFTAGITVRLDKDDETVSVEIAPNRRYSYMPGVRGIISYSELVHSSITDAVTDFIRANIRTVLVLAEKREQRNIAKEAAEKAAETGDDDGEGGEPDITYRVLDDKGDTVPVVPTGRSKEEQAASAHWGSGQ